MKTMRSSPRANAGSTLLLTLVIAAIVGFVLIAYLNLVRAQNMSTMRSQAWNVAVPVIEAGVEDALAHLAAHAGADLACDGWWGYNGGYYMFRRVGDHFYLVVITNYFPGSFTNSPVIESRGYVSLPTLVSSVPGPVLAQSTTTTRNYLGRGVRVRTRQDYLWSKPWTMRDTIDLAGNNIRTDSFDSTSTNASTAGRYDPAKRRANGDIATNSSLTNSLNIGNADIFGRVSTGPRGSVSIGPQGSVGDLAWHAAGRRGIQPGYYTDDMNVDFREPKVPFSGGAFTPGGGNITNADGTVTYYDYILDDGNYQLSTLGGKTYVRGNATLLVTSSIQMTGSDELRIQTNKTFKLYMSGATANLGGNGVINGSGFATNFTYYGLSNNVSFSIGGNGAIIGTVYAPNAQIVLNGGGNSNTDFIGAAIGRSSRLNGHFNVHYDESLGRTGQIRGYVITGWDEMSPSEVGQTVVSLSF